MSTATLKKKQFSCSGESQFRGSVHYQGGEHGGIKEEILEGIFQK